MQQSLDTSWPVPDEIPLVLLLLIPELLKGSGTS